MEPQPAGGGPAPFLQKTYDMVEDSSTDTIVSWGSKRHTFIVWDPLEFARQLLPAYFKHSNFSSFIRQLNTYGFRKVDQEKWEFSNKDFVRGERHRLKNIHRRKPIHSHSLPVVDPERLALEEEIERLSREGERLKEAFGGLGQMDVWGAFQFEEAERKMEDVACRLDKLESFLLKAIHRPAFVEQLVKLTDASALDFSMFSRKRRLLQRDDTDGSPELVDNSVNEGHSSSSKAVDFTHLFPQDFSNKLRLELCPATPNGGVPLGETEDSDDCRVCSPPRAALEGQADIMECRLFLPEEVEPMDTYVPLCQKRNNSLPWFPSNDDDDEQNISCQLKLTLASSPMNFDESQLPDKISKSVNQNMDEAADWRSKNVSKDDNQGTRPVGMDSTIPVASTANNQGNGPSPGRVNDLFWEQFLTERPGSTENEEASSCLRSSSKEDRAVGSETWMNRNDMGTMKL